MLELCLKLLLLSADSPPLILAQLIQLIQLIQLLLPDPNLVKHLYFAAFPDTKFHNELLRFENRTLIFFESSEKLSVQKIG